MHVAIITARSGSQSIIEKNTMQLAGLPLVGHPIAAAQAATRVDRVFVSTDGDRIADIALRHQCGVIRRPPELSGDAEHGLVIRHAVHAAARECGELENVAVLLGNTVMVDGPLIDRALDELDADPRLDSVMTVWEAQDDHPYRAMQVDDDGCLRPFGDVGRQVGTTRQSYPKAYFYDQGVWAFRAGCVDRRDGPNPWWWMGRRCRPIVRPWVTGRDIHSPLDVDVAAWWLERRQAARGAATHRIRSSVS